MTNNTQPNQVDFDNRDIARYTAGERRMPMRGFDPQYTDIVDYIIRITHRIWEEKAVGYIYETYQHNCVVHGSGGDVYGAKRSSRRRCSRWPRSPRVRVTATT
jgi:hypothetical protein